MPEDVKDKQSANLPTKAFEYYVEGAKWLVVVASGVLAFGFGQLKDHSKGWSYFIFLIYGALLTTAVTSGLFYIWYSYSYASKRGAGQDVDSGGVKRVKKLSDRWFCSLLWSFGLGMGAFLIFAFAVLGEMRNEQSELSVTEITTPEVGVALAEHKGQLWLLQRTPKGLVWRGLLPPPPKD